MTRQFADDLTKVADEARFVDLSGRVRTASRRMTVRRGVTAGAAALILVIAGIAGVTMFRDTTQAPPAEFGRFGGTFLYLTTNPDDGTVELQRADATGTSTVLTISGGEVSGPVSVSPTGEWAAWESDIDPGHRAVMVAALSTGDVTELFQYDPSDTRMSCPAPTWAPDGTSKLLTVDPNDPVGGVQWFDASTKESIGSVSTAKERGGQTCELYPAVRDGGGYDLYYARDAFELRYLEPDGTFVDTGAIAALRESGTDGDWTGLSGLNPDGSAACLSVPTETEDVTCALVIDPRTGDVVRDFGSDPPADVRFLPDGELLTRDADGVLRRIDANGDVVALLNEDDRFAGADLAGYLPD